MDAETIYQLQFDPTTPGALDRLAAEWRDALRVVGGGPLRFMGGSGSPTRDDWRAARDKMIALLGVGERWANFYYDSPHAKPRECLSMTRRILENSPDPLYNGDPGFDEWAENLWEGLRDCELCFDGILQAAADFRYELNQAKPVPPAAGKGLEPAFASQLKEPYRSFWNALPKDGSEIESRAINLPEEKRPGDVFATAKKLKNEHVKSFVEAVGHEGQTWWRKYIS